VPDCAIASGCPVPDGRLIFRIADETADGPPAAFGPAPAPACRDLLELLAGVTGGRPGQGRDHPVAAVLALAAAAVVAGSRSFTAIAGWAADVPDGVMQELYQRCGATRPSAGPPPEATIWRVVTGPVGGRPGGAARGRPADGGTGRGGTRPGPDCLFDRLPSGLLRESLAGSSTRTTGHRNQGASGSVNRFAPARFCPPYVRNHCYAAPHSGTP
jgi:DDE_Tnp_1-associated